MRTLSANHTTRKARVSIAASRGHGPGEGVDALAAAAATAQPNSVEAWVVGVRGAR